MNSPPVITGIGELLWDCLPEGRQLGGAPANVVYHAQMLGMEGHMVSRVGEDSLGKEAVDQLRSCGIATDAVQTDREHPTGTVEITLENSEASYRFADPSAWDGLEWTDALSRLAAESDVVIFGTLAQRCSVSQSTILRFLREAESTCRICDVNIREPYISTDVLQQAVALTDVLKMSAGELPRVLSLLGMEQPDSPVATARQLIAAYGIQLVCITRGVLGSLLVTADDVHEHSGTAVRVQDTVGAGDAFTAALAWHLLAGSPLSAAGAAANALGSWVAAQAGAMPPYPPEVLSAVKMA